MLYNIVAHCVSTTRVLCYVNNAQLLYRLLGYRANAVLHCSLDWQTVDCSHSRSHYSLLTTHHSTTSCNPHDPCNPCTAAQGPFRAACEVQTQRYRPLSPTLRVASEYDTLTQLRQQARDEEWAQRLSDNMYVRSIRARKTSLSSSWFSTSSSGFSFFIAFLFMCSCCENLPLSKWAILS